MKRFLLLTLLVYSVVVPFFLTAAQPASVDAASSTQTKYERVDAYLDAQLQNMHIPGMAIAVVEGDQIAHLRGYGTMGPSAEPVTAQTPFILGSVSKSVTALAVMQLVEAGKLDLDAPVQKYLPWFEAQDIKIRHLLNQNSGITTRAGRSMLADNYQGSDAIQIYARKMSAEPRHRQVGESYEYSNANYIILGAVIEAVSGQSYEAYMREHIFDPLGMADTFASQRAATMRRIATGHSQVLGIPIPLNAPYPAGNVPAGYLITSAEDMAHFMVAQLNDGVYQGKQIVSAAGVATLHHGVAAIPGGRFYAMGWEAGEYERLNAISHRGDLPNFQSNVILLPEQKIGLIILMNVYSTFNNLQISHLTWDVAHLLVGQEPVTLSSEPMMYVVVGIVAATVLIILLLLWWANHILQNGSKRKPWGRMAAAAFLLLGMAGFNLIVFPILFETPIPAMLLFAPELAWPVVVGGCAAALGAIVFPILLTLRGHFHSAKLT